ncbi:MAG: guanine deaminase [Bryobacteraceae bacterium]
MSPASNVDLWRATIFHTPRSPFRNDGALVALPDGGLATQQGRIVACGDYSDVQKNYPDATAHDLRGGFLLPGFVDTHVHYPQSRILGGLGYSLLDWLDQLALPEEAKLADVNYAIEVAGEFTQALAGHGTTTAMVFGSHFPGATAALFKAAAERGLRIFSGLVLADRNLRPELHQSPEAAYRDSKALIDCFHRKQRIGYAVTPRFALSASDGMLEVCQSLLRETAGLRFQTHINEQLDEVAKVLEVFPWANNYLAVYERFDLIGRHSVLAHNVRTTRGELARLAASRSSIAHCPCSNASLGSGIFPMRQHLEAGVHFSLGTDVGGGTGFGMLKEALHAYLFQRLADSQFVLNPGQLLYLATRAGAEALAIEEETGDFTPGKSADFVYLRATDGSPLAAVLDHTDEPDRKLAALFTLAGAESVRNTWVEGQLVFGNEPAL